MEGLKYRKNVVRMLVVRVYVCKVDKLRMELVVV